VVMLPTRFPAQIPSDPFALQTHATDPCSHFNVLTRLFATRQSISLAVRKLILPCRARLRSAASGSG
jgi:hypothetical protein